MLALVCSVLTDMCMATLFVSLFPVMQSMLSGDFDDLLTESLDASSVKVERGQVRGVEGRRLIGKGRSR